MGHIALQHALSLPYNEEVKGGIKTATSCVAAFYGYSLITLLRMELKFWDESRLKNTPFMLFKPDSHRLIAKWAEDQWLTADDMRAHRTAYRADFESSIKNAARGAWITRYAQSEYYLISFHKDILEELASFNALRRELVLINTFAYGLKEKAEKWIAIINHYEKRLKFIQDTVLAMDEYSRQLADRQRRILIAYGEPNVEVNYKVPY